MTTTIEKTKPFVNFLDELSKFLKIQFEIHNTEVERSFAEIWFKPINLETLYEYQPAYSCKKKLAMLWIVCDRSVTNIISMLRDENLEGFRWITPLPKSNKEWDLIQDFAMDTIHFFNRDHNKQRQHLFQEVIINAFFRLTNYNQGAMVPLWDLIDNEMTKEFEYRSVKPKILPKTALKNVVRGVLFALDKLNVPFPAPYYHRLEVLEKTDELNEALRMLERSFAETNNQSKIH